MYILMGDPIPLARARTSYVLRRCYDSQKMQKMITGIELTKQHDDRPLFTGPLLFKCTFYLPLPSTVSKKKEPQYINKYHTTRPDCDNLVKYILDVCQGICYNSDAIVSKIEATKLYCPVKEARTEFEFIVLKEHV